MRCRTCDSLLLLGYKDSLCPRCALAGALSVGETERAEISTEKNYELIEKLGHGAMGVVWLARDRRLDRLVALKLIATGAHPLLAKRLLREGQAVARLRHPHIVAVHALNGDGATTSLAMDFLEGGNLDEFLRGHLLAPREVAVLVAKLADALTFAHESGLLHRDLKPSNILMDGRGEPHLADFGLAAPLEGDGELTTHGEVAGTPAYLAPELIDGTGRASPRSDVYGLGAVLYTCLAGRAPFLGSTAEILTQLRTTEPPSPRLLRPNVPRDLETICLKSLNKLPQKRYDSARAFKEDIERFLQGKPIAARPVGELEKILRWGGRNPAAAISIGLAAVLVLLLAIGGPLVALNLNRARRVAENARAQAEVARAQAATEAAVSREVSDFLQNDLLAQASPDNQPNRDLKLATIVDRAAKGIEGRFADQPLVEASVRDTLGKTYGALGDYPAMQRHLERAVALRKKILGPESPTTLIVLADLVVSLRNQGKYQEVEALAAGALALQRKVLGLEHPATLHTMMALGGTYYLDGKLPEAETLMQQTLDVQQRVLGAEHPDTIKSMNGLVALYGYEGKLTEAETLATKTLEIARRVLGLEHPETMRAMNNLAVEHLNLEKTAEAEALALQTMELRARVLGPEHVETLVTMKYLADIYEAEGKLDEAEALYRKTVGIETRVLGPEHPYTLNLMNNFSVALRINGKLSEAETVAIQTLTVRRRTIGANHPDTLGTMNALAEIYRDEGRQGDAEALFATTLEAKRRVLGEEHPATLITAENLAALLLQESKFMETELLARPLVESRSRATGAAWKLASAESLLGAALAGQKRFAEAEACLLAAYAGLQKDKARIPARQRTIIGEPGQRLLVLYNEWGQTAKADAWKATLAQPGEKPAK